MGNNMIYVPADEYRELCEIAGRVKAAEAVINSSTYSVDKKEILGVLGLNVPEGDDEE